VVLCKKKRLKSLLQTDKSVSYFKSFMSLTGKRVVITRPPEQADTLAEQLRQLGAMPILFPTIQLQPAPGETITAVLPHLSTYYWLIFTSSNAVEFFFRYLSRSHTLPPIAVSGPKTAEKLRTYGIEPVFMPDKFVGEALVAGLGDLSGKKLLFPRAKIGRSQIVDLLRQQGATVDEIPLYNTVTAVPTPGAIAEIANGFDAITFTSPSCVRSFLEILEAAGLNRTLLETAVVACIGPITAEQTIALGLPVHVMPTEYTTEALVAALATYFSEQ
jgi:uroporphyrinogen-III synthase